MSDRTKTHPINKENNDRSVLYFYHSRKTYAIPKQIAELYVVDETFPEDNIPAELVFAELNAKFTKPGALLQGTRHKEGLTQIEFAKKINVTQSSLSKMERGRRPIGKTIAKRIEKVFGPDYRIFWNN